MNQRWQTSTLDIEARTRRQRGKEITIDISELEIGDSLHLEEIQLPKGVRSASVKNVTLVACVPPKEEEEVAAAPAEGEALPEGAEGAAPVEGAPEAKEGKEGKEGKPSSDK